MKLAALHSITSSAISSRSRGTSRFSDLAVLRLIEFGRLQHRQISRLRL
jgi:hypothetical protein